MMSEREVQAWRRDVWWSLVWVVLLVISFRSLWSDSRICLEFVSHDESLGIVGLLTGIISVHWQVQLCTNDCQLPFSNTMKGASI